MESTFPITIKKGAKVNLCPKSDKYTFSIEGPGIGLVQWTPDDDEQDDLRHLLGHSQQAFNAMAEMVIDRYRSFSLWPAREIHACVSNPPEFRAITRVVTDGLKAIGRRGVKQHRACNPQNGLGAWRKFARMMFG